MTQPEQEAREVQPRDAAFDLVARIIQHMGDDLAFVADQMPAEDLRKFYDLRDEARQWLIAEGAALDAFAARPTAGIDREVVARLVDPYIVDDGSHISHMAAQIALEKADAILSPPPRRRKNRGAGCCYRGVCEGCGSVCANDRSLAILGGANDRVLAANPGKHPRPLATAADRRCEMTTVIEAADTLSAKEWAAALSCGDHLDRFPCASCGARLWADCRAGLTAEKSAAARDFINGYGWSAALKRPAALPDAPIVSGEEPKL